MVDGLMEELFGQPYDDGGEHVSMLWAVEVQYDMVY